MKKRIRKIMLFIFIFFYIFLLLFLRGKVIEKSREIYKKEKEILESEYKVHLYKLDYLKICFIDKEEVESRYAER